MTQEEMDKRVRELWDMFEETDRRLKEFFAETDRRIRETDKQLKESFADTDRRIKEVSEQIKASEKKANTLTDKWGLFVEGLVVPAAKKLFREWGIELQQVYQRVNAASNGHNMEVDVLATSVEYSVLIEAKSTLTVADVNEHLERLSQFKEMFPHYTDTKVIGAVAGIVISEDADKYAYRQGLFVVGQSGETVKVLNDRSFQPKVW